jgi:predicted phosphoribosyltransferase
LVFSNRRQAGALLAEKFKDLATKSPLILAIPRGGVEVGYELSVRWRAPLDVVISRKIGAPFDPELAIGALTEEGEVIRDQNFFSFDLDQIGTKRVILEGKREIERRAKLYRGESAPVSINGRVVVIVDDGIATGSTMQAAILSLKPKNPKELIVAAPVASREAIFSLEPLVSRICVLHVPEVFFAVGQFYENFVQTSDEIVCKLLRDSRQKIKEEE